MCLTGWEPGVGTERGWGCVGGPRALPSRAPSTDDSAAVASEWMDGILIVAAVRMGIFSGIACICAMFCQHFQCAQTS